MLQIRRSSYTYKYLNFAYNVVARFRNRTEERAVQNLENDSFCAMVRTAIIWCPLTILFQITWLCAIIYFGIVVPFLWSYNTFAPLYLPGIILMIAAFIGLLYCVIWLIVTIIIPAIKKGSKKAPKSYINESDFSKFKKAAYASWKEKFCPLITFKGDLDV